METRSRLTPWLNRMVLAFATFIFIMIGVKNVVDPVKANTEYKMVLASPEAITNIRVGFGAFPLGFAIILFGCLLAKRRHLSGLLMLAVIDGVVIAARVFGLITDGHAAWTLKVLRPEVLILAVAILAIFLETRRMNKAAMITGQALKTSNNKI